MTDQMQRAVDKAGRGYLQGYEEVNATKEILVIALHRSDQVTCSMRASVVLLRQSVCLGAESVVEPHGKRPVLSSRGRPGVNLGPACQNGKFLMGWCGVKETSKRPSKFTIRKYICYG